MFSSFACIKYTSTIPIVQTFSTLFSLFMLIYIHSK